MHFPRHWAKAHHEMPTPKGPARVDCWRWSDISIEDARERAVEAARKVAEAFVRDGRPPDRYGYGDRPLREPVLRQIQDESGDVVAAITRNAHGCEVLNTTRAMFVDVDFPETSSIWRRVLLLFKDGRAATPGIDRVHAWVASHPEWGFRVYRTAAGLRLLATHRPIALTSPEAEVAFDALGTDPLYRRLCKLQESYRARLTPKPWRCHVDPPKWTWPFAGANDEREFERWQSVYRQAAKDHATCQFLETVGSATVHPEIAPIVRLHDQATGVGSNSKLA